MWAHLCRHIESNNTWKEGRKVGRRRKEGRKGEEGRKTLFHTLN